MLFTATAAVASKAQDIGRALGVDLSTSAQRDERRYQEARADLAKALAGDRVALEHLIHNAQHSATPAGKSYNQEALREYFTRTGFVPDQALAALIGYSPVPVSLGNSPTAPGTPQGGNNAVGATSALPTNGIGSAEPVTHAGAVPAVAGVPLWLVGAAVLGIIIARS